MSTSSDQFDNPRLVEGVFLYLMSASLVAAAIIVLFSVTITPLLDIRSETLAESRIEVTSTENKSIRTASCHPGWLYRAGPGSDKIVELE
jgi:hypothetical protein